MPNCRHCLHQGRDHNWRVPDCSVCARRDPDCVNCWRNRELRRLRGACLYFDGKRRWTWCAYDAVGVLSALGADGIARSTSLFSGQPIEVVFAAETRAAGLVDEPQQHVQLGTRRRGVEGE